MTLVGISSVTATASSSTLAALGVSLHAGLKRLVLIPAGTVNWALGGAASGSTPAVSSTGIEMPIDRANAESLEFYGSNVALTVLQFA